MTKRNLNFKEIADAATSLEKQGLEPNTINIREYLGSGSLTTISKYLQKWRNEKEHEEIVEEIDLKGTLEKMGNELLIEFFSNEHPQVLALALTHLKPENAALILEKYPEDLKSNILRRIEKIGPVQKNIIQRIAQVLKSETKDIQNSMQVIKGGKEFVVQVKKQMQTREHK